MPSLKLIPRPIKSSATPRNDDDDDASHESGEAAVHHPPSIKPPGPSHPTADAPMPVPSSDGCYSLAAAAPTFVAATAAAAATATVAADICRTSNAAGAQVATRTQRQRRTVVAGGGQAVDSRGGARRRPAVLASAPKALKLNRHIVEEEQRHSNAVMMSSGSKGTGDLIEADEVDPTDVPNDDEEDIRECPICREDYTPPCRDPPGEDGGNTNAKDLAPSTKDRCPVILKCCRNVICVGCAERDRASKASELKGRRKRIGCMLCNALYHCENDTPYVRHGDESSSLTEEGRQGHDASWNSRLEELREYNAMPKGSTSFNKQLGMWVKRQRTQHRLLQQGKKSQITEERIAALENVGFQWAVNAPATDWETRFEELLRYKALHGHCNTPQRCSENKALGVWVSYQRAQHRLKQQGKKSRITDDHIASLESIGFQWALAAPRVTDWETRLQELSGTNL